MDTSPQRYTPAADTASDAGVSSEVVLGYLLDVLRDAPAQHDDPEAEALRGEVVTRLNRYLEDRAEDAEAAEWELALAREAAVHYQAIERWNRNPADKGSWEEQQNTYRGTMPEQ